MGTKGTQCNLNNGSKSLTMKYYALLQFSLVCYRHTFMYFESLVHGFCANVFCSTDCGPYYKMGGQAGLYKQRDLNAAKVNT